MDDWRANRIRSAIDGTNPTVLARLPGAFAVMGDVQWLPGYCVLLVDRPGVGALADLGRDEQLQFLGSMATLGTAVESACRAADHGFRRMNFDILGNTDEFLHAHVWPRYGWGRSMISFGWRSRSDSSNWVARCPEVWQQPTRRGRRGCRRGGGCLGW